MSSDDEEYFVEAEKQYSFYCPRCGADEYTTGLGWQKCDSCGKAITVYHESDE